MRLVPAFLAALAACATAPAPERAPVATVAPAPLDDAALSARCARGFAADCRTLGRGRLAGEGGARDDRLTAALLTKACEIGDPAACADVGVLYALGRGVAQSDARAFALSRRACEQGAGIACSNEGALLAEGASGGAAGLPQESADARAGRVVRLLRAACEAGVPEGCTNLGTALEADRLAVRDVRAAGRAYRRACDAGFALACHRLALLVADRADVAPDLTSTALEARACRAAIAPACYAVSEKTPAQLPTTPAARLVDDRASLALGIPGTGGFSPGELAGVRAAGPRRTIEDVRRPRAAVQDAVPQPLRTRLGVGVPPRSVDDDDPPVELLVELRRHQLGQCYEAPRAAGRERVEVFSTFYVDGDGRPLDVRAASTPADAVLDACVTEIVGQWEFPASPEGVTGPYLARHTYEAAAEPAQFAGPGSLRPSLRDPSCVERALAVPTQYRGSTGGVTVKLAVDGAGAPALLHALTPVPEPILGAVTDAVKRCAWSPGADAEGRPVPLWVTLTVKLESR